jgi:putative flippase GtrA
MTRFALRGLARLFDRGRLLRFFAAGGVNTAFSYGLYVLFIYMGLRIALASLLALLLGIVFSFVTHGTFVFRNATPYAFAKFVLAWILLYLVNLGIIHILVDAGLSAYLAGALATAPVIVLAYLILNRIVFRQRDCCGSDARPQRP